MTLFKSTIPVLDISNVSFIVNTKKCGKGGIKCIATYPDGKEAIVVKEKIEEYIFRIKVLPIRTGPLHLHIDHVPIDGAKDIKTKILKHNFKS